MDGVSEETAFLARLKEDPGDLGLRLVFADWLEEHGRVALAELFRVEVELARLPPFGGAVLLGPVPSVPLHRRRPGVVGPTIHRPV